MKVSEAVQCPEEKPMDPHVALQKLLRLDRKHTNFDFSDPARNVQFRVQNPVLLNDAPPSDHLLRHFWRHVHNYYFRRPEEPEIDRLEYLWSILNEELSHELPFRPSQDFWMVLHMVFSPEYLRQHTWATTLDSRNWLCTLHLYFLLLDNPQPKSHKKAEKEYRELLGARNKLVPATDPHLFQQSLRQEELLLNKLLPQINQEDDQVAQQIRNYQQQLQAHHNNTLRLFRQLQHRVAQEQDEHLPIFCFGNTEYPIPPPLSRPDHAIIAERLAEVDLQLRYYEYTINCLEEKQVAESIAKILKVEKQRGEPKLLISFEEAMNAKSKSVSEAELVRLNKVREYSLFKFYNTSLKTPYSFICQNFVGFREIYLHRNQACKFKNKTILEEMKKAGNQSPEEVKGFQKFEICHHCKLLYPDNFLVKCRYNSERMGIPIQPAPFCDPYLTQISKIETTKSQRYSTRRRNWYQNYTKSGEEYLCNRKFCKFCLRQNYEDGLDKNGLCPFCQGICFCTRCTRNDMIVRLKGIYLLLGGQMSKFHSDWFFELDNDENSEEEVKSVRKKGRPKKVLKRLSSTPNKTCDHINSIRVQLEPLRLLSDMVKKRQKTKYKLLQVQQEFFLEKVAMVSKDFSSVQTNGRNLDSTDQQDSESLDLDQLRKRRNHRMI